MHQKRFNSLQSFKKSYVYVFIVKKLALNDIKKQNLYSWLILGSEKDKA